jgi:hypothetical protein
MIAIASQPTAPSDDRFSTNSGPSLAIRRTAAVEPFTDIGAGLRDM